MVFCTSKKVLEALHEKKYIDLLLGRRRNAGGRTTPMFPPRMWSVHDRTLHDQVKMFHLLN